MGRGGGRIGGDNGRTLRPIEKDISRRAQNCQGSASKIVGLNPDETDARDRA